MSKERTAEQIAIMQAYIDGKTIQHRDRRFLTMWREDSDPSWAWDNYVYRVKQVPREFWINLYSTHLGRVYTDKDTADANALFSRIKCIHVREVTDTGF